MNVGRFNHSIIKYELLRCVRDKSIITLIALLSLFAMLGIYNAWQHSENQLNAIALASNAQQQAIAESAAQLAARQSRSAPISWWQDVHDLRGQAFYLMVNYAAKSPLPESAIAVGQADIYPYLFRMLVNNKQQLAEQYDYQNPLLLKLGQFDLAFVLIYLLPLVLIAINHNVLAYEHHSGQFKILALQGETGISLSVHQLIARAMCVLLPLVLTVIATLYYFNRDIQFNSYLILVGAIVCYALFWMVLILLCVSFARPATFNAAVLMSSWLCLVVIIPAALTSFIEFSHPTPSRIEYIDTLRASTDKVNHDASKALSNYLEDHPELRENEPAKGSYVLTRVAKIDALERAMKPTDDAFTETLISQQALAQQFRFLTPATLLQTSLNRISGNDLARHQAFMSAVSSHHQTLREFFMAQMFVAVNQSAFSPCAGCNAEVTLADLSLVPQFKPFLYEREKDAWYVELIALLLLSVAMLCVAFRRLFQFEKFAYGGA